MWLGIVLSVACTGTPTGADPVPEDTAPDPPDHVLTGVASTPEDTSRLEPLQVGLVRVVFGEGPMLAEALTSEALDEDGSFALGWDEEAAEALTQTPGNDYPELGVAFFAVLVWEDGDGDGEWAAGEVLRGGSFSRWVLYIEGQGEADWPQGWTQADLGIEGQYLPNRCLLDSSLLLSTRADEGYPTFHDLDEPVDIVLRGLEAELTLGGLAAEEARESRLVSLPWGYLTGELTEVEPVFDVGLGESWTASLTAEPPADHDAGADPDWRYTVHANLVYEDDGDGAWSPDDSLSGATTCLAGEWAYSRYTRAVSSYKGLRLLDCYAGQSGWRVATVDEDSGATLFHDAEDAADLVVYPVSCSL